MSPLLIGENAIFNANLLVILPPEFDSMPMNHLWYCSTLEIDGTFGHFSAFFRDFQKRESKHDATHESNLYGRVCDEKNQVIDANLFSLFCL